MSQEQVPHDEVDDALRAVDELDETTPLAVHADAFERAHEALQRRLEDAT
ncbi:hypothetical protein [Pseudactinotalea terrae]|nr:hypothetical protein [Pseudactinotalea terrae]